MIDREMLNKSRDDGFARAQAWLDGKEEREKRERLRDTFAAAALTGLLGRNDIFQHEGAPLPYEYADAMLRERERTNHDASPEAKAAEPESSVPLGSECGTGSTQEPVAWAVVYPHGEEAIIAFRKADADDMASASDRVVPLYRQPQPTLTTDEREAVEWFSHFARPQNGPVIGKHAATLRSLLERLK